MGWDTEVTQPPAYLMDWQRGATNLDEVFRGLEEYRSQIFNDRIEDSNSAERRGKLCRQT